MLETLLNKNQVLHSLQNLPEQISSEDLIEHILFMAQVQRGIQQANEGKVVTHEQLMKELADLRIQKQAERRAKVA
ncbi:MAG: hypothetical protein EAZ91_03555 [Cytophagales bacterium]|nr:MAG: hypothetical protein EAZ91_03555 [Cytophagales bacterium]